MITGTDLVAYAEMNRDHIGIVTARKWLKGDSISPASAVVCDRAFARFMREAIKFKKAQYGRYLSPSNSKK